MTELVARLGFEARLAAIVPRLTFYMPPGRTSD